MNIFIFVSGFFTGIVATFAFGYWMHIRQQKRVAGLWKDAISQMQEVKKPSVPDSMPEEL